jgi:flagellar FliL protein
MADEEEEPKKKSGIKKIAVFAVGGILIMGIGLGAGYFLFGSKPNSPEQLVAEIIQRNSPAAAQASDGDEAEAQEAEQRDRVEKRSVRNQVFRTLYFEFPGTLTTNLKDSRRFLQIGIGVSTQYDQTILTNVETHLPAITAALLAALSDYSEEDVVGREARIALAEDLKDTINAELERLEGFGGVEGVHLTSYVMQ